MPRRGMRSLFFSPKTTSFHESASPPSRNRLISESIMELTIDAAATIIMKWDTGTSSYAKVTSLFYESKAESTQFIKSVNDLHKIMHSLSADHDSGSKILIQAQRLMDIAMKRLQKEFYQILSMNRSHFDPESVSTRSSRVSTRSSRASTQSSLSLDFDSESSPDNDINAVGDSISKVEEISFMAMSDLKSIADCMIGSGYAKECMQIYTIIRRSIIDEGIYKLGIQKLSASRINKMEWDVLDSKIKEWSVAMKISMRTLFVGERILCGYIFSSSDSIRESCFSEITKEGAIALFGFPELVAKTKISTSDKIFSLLSMYRAISDHWEEIETIFSFESTSAIRLQALNSLTRLSESVRSLLLVFESTIQKEYSSKSMIPAAGGLHPLTIYSMNYLTLLSDYSNILIHIMPDLPTPAKSSLPVSDELPASAISVRIARLMLVLICKLDSKSKHYKDVSISYLFLANNLQHVISTVHKSNLQYLLGEDWIGKHEAKLNRLAANHKRLAFGNGFASLPENPTAHITKTHAKECFKKKMLGSSYITVFIQFLFTR